MNESEWAQYRPAGSWPEDDRPTATAEQRSTAAADSADAEPPESHAEANPPPKTYPPRTCRICLETVQPTYHLASENIPGFLRSKKPRVTYESSDPELGRLLRPCKCKGSSRYVHEQCLTLWRHADPGYGRRNFWQCPTCGFRYRLDRMRLGQWITSPVTQVVLTVVALLLVMFLLGFVADPIISLYIDPFDTLLSGFFEEGEGGPQDDLLPGGRRNVLARGVPAAHLADEEASWAEHFVKGLASLGVLSFAKVLLALSPWQWWNLRGAGLLGRSGSRPAATGRDRVSSVSWIVIAVGVVTFLVVCAWP